jgi:hypothetical protein
LCCRRTMLQHSKQNSDSAPYSPNNYFNIISSKSSLTLRFTDKNIICISHFPRVSHVLMT